MIQKTLETLKQEILRDDDEFLEAVKEAEVVRMCKEKPNA
jgi:hypothetical protein